MLASDIPAHRAFGVATTGSLAEAVAAIVTAFNDPARAEAPAGREPVLHDWVASGVQLRAEIDALLARKPGTAAAAAERRISRRGYRAS